MSNAVDKFNLVKDYPESIRALFIAKRFVVVVPSPLLELEQGKLVPLVQHVYVIG